MEHQESESSRHRNTERLDNIWASFRLEVPLATKGKYADNGIGGVDPASSAARDEWLLQALDLLGLLHTMDQLYANPNAPRNKDGSPATSTLRESRMKSLMKLAYSTLAKVERTFPSQEGQKENTAKMQDGNNPEYADKATHQNLHNLLEKLRNDTEGICAKFQQWLDQCALGQRRQERDMIYDIFLAPEDTDKEHENSHNEHLDEFDDNKKEDEYEDSTAGKDVNSQTTPAILSQRQSQPAPRRESSDPVEFQKQQQDLLEEELASMAARLKTSTLAMNSTLQNQTKELDSMEQLAQANLDQVADTAKKVGERLVKKRGWKKRLATWSLLCTIVGMWVVCFVVIRTVPKRKVGKVHLIGKGRGEGTFWSRWKHYFSNNDELRDGRPSSSKREEMSRNRERQHQEQQQRQQQEQAQEKWKKQQEQEQRRRQHQQGQQQQQQEECEVASDGTQVCFDSENEAGRMEAKARELAAERRRRRIQEKMANAPAVEIVDSNGEEEVGSVRDKEDFVYDANGNDQDYSQEDNANPMGCIPPTDQMHSHRSAMHSLSSALTQMWENPRRREKIQSHLEKHTLALEQAKSRALSEFWRDKENRIKARDAHQDLGSISFCGWEDAMGELSRNEEEVLREKKAQMMATRESAKKADERDLAENVQRQKNQEEALRAQMDQRNAEAEIQRSEEERLAAARKVAGERQRRQTEGELTSEAERLEQERSVTKAAKHTDLGRFDSQQVEQEQGLVERRKQEEEQVHRLAEEQAEARRLEQEKLAAEAAKLSELQRFEERIKQERSAAEKAEIEGLQEERLASEAVEQAENEKFEKEQIEQERLAAEQLETEKIEQQRLEAKAESRNLEEKRLAAEAEAARLEQERLDQERLAAEEERLAAEEAAKQADLERLEQEQIKNRQLAAEQEAIRLEQVRQAVAAAKELENTRRISEAKAEAEAGAIQAMEQSKQIGGDYANFLPSDIRIAAGHLKNDLLAYYISISPEMVDASDRSGWRPIHEAARSGNLAGVQLLVSSGCDLTSRTGRTGNGGTALWWAIQRFGEDSSVVRLLRSHGALEAGPA